MTGGIEDIARVVGVYRDLPGLPDHGLSVPELLLLAATARGEVDPELGLRVRPGTPWLTDLSAEDRQTWADLRDYGLVDEQGVTDTGWAALDTEDES